MRRFLDDRLPCRPEEKNPPLQRKESKDVDRSYGRWKNFRKFFYGKDACEEFCGNPSPDRRMHRFLYDRLPCSPEEKNCPPAFPLSPARKVKISPEEAALAGGKTFESPFYGNMHAWKTERENDKK
ncbi:hypothetical protein CDAR_475371 [Caerostris darwini]|uniref:Uncharacterized protein n=1 Tax=Caerostris darwini TaxID=1538125 RepID=A0AAV4PEJ3_9ARAC|nr:hypothetical protein CDAR_475371 [Caerostris darwini]